ncbi:hypothetical protein NOF04DRAFT_13134 [Fusarium oxysporum II5]|uniref:Uncharacterized protein n=1 Tax=Fusarium odoratissimum (strain NRRL 54006) TaxID=1089451 RepID=X0IZ29_FUSO5|nr:uncharacterized protein FOIG_13099 [Fusarium odoratissimum NRRL 54006]EXL94223.1 hypothetical protein FOIG_13099 [Fusarium odoratissimum NRRL 54006]KAK2128597.1 hypothetical protein NOF04DRAFT_13134 [Fusarium oxysporum II5]
MASYMKHASRRKISPTATGTEVRASNRGQPPRPITRFQTGRVAAYTPGDLLATCCFRGTSLSADHDIFKNDPIENCGLRSPGSFRDPKANCYVGRCFGVAFTSYVDAVICQTCIAKEERDNIRRNNKKAVHVFEK